MNHWKFMKSLRVVDETNAAPAGVGDGVLSDIQSFHKFSKCAGVFAVLLGLGTLIGWTAGLPLLTHLLPGLPSMKPNTALAMVAIGCSVFSSVTSCGGRISTTIRQACAAVAFALGASTLCEYLAGADWGIDQFIWTVYPTGGRFPGRMAPNTTLTITLVSAALMLLDNPRRALQATSQCLTVGALALTYLATVGYVFNAPALYGAPGYSSMSLNGSIGLGVCAVGLLCARPRRGLAAIVTQDNAAGTGVRRVLPALLVALLILGSLELRALSAGWFGAEFGAALLVSGCTAVLLIVLLWNANFQGRDDARREEALQLIDAVKDCAIVLLDATGRLSTWNVGAERLLGYVSREMIGRKFALFSPAGVASHEVCDRALQMAKSSERYEYEEWLWRKGGSSFLAHITVSTIRGARGDLKGFAQVIRDITERSQATDQLSMALEAAPCGMLMTDAAGNIVLMNARVETLFAHTRDEMLGKSVDWLLPDRSRGTFKELLNRFSTAPDGESLVEDHSLFGLRKDGQEIPLEIQLTHLHTARGHYVLGAITDLTERWRAEERGERQFQMLADAMPQLVWMAEPDGHIFWYNHRWYDYTGTSFEDMEGWGWKSVHDPVELPKVLEKWQGCIASGQPFDMVFPIKGKDGNFRPFLTRVVPIRDDEGRVVRWFGTNTDVTELRRAAEVEQMMNAVVESAEDAILTKTLDGTIRTWNSAAERMFGYSAAEMIGTSVLRLIPDDRESEEAVIIAQVKQGKAIAHFETQRRARHGALVDVSLTVSPILDAHGDVVGASKILRDITGQKAVAAQTKKDHERFAIASEAAGMGFWDYDLVSNRLRWDDQMFALYGRSRAEGEQPYDLWAHNLHPDDRARSECELQDAIAGIRPFDTEFRIIYPSGEIRFIRASARVMRDDAGNATQVFGLNFDVTERRGILDRLEAANQQLDSALRASQSFLARVGAVAGVGGWGLDLRSNVLTWSDETNRLYDTPPDYRPTVDEALAFYTAESRLLIENATRECIELSKPYDLQLEMVSATGRRFWARVSGTAEVENGSAVRLVGAVQDITLTRRAALELEQVSSLLKMVLESASEVSMIATDAGLNIKIFNAGAERLLGYRSDEIVDRETLDLFHDPAEMRARGEELSALQGRRVAGHDVLIAPSTLRQARDWTYVRKDGRRVPVSLVVTAMFAQDGTVLGYLGIARDVTHQAQYEESLRDATTQAKKANSAKSEFLANMSHEIRTPLNAVIGLGYLLDQTTLSADQRQLLAKIQFAGRSLLGVVINVLDLSKIEAGEMELETEPFDLAATLQSVCHMLAPQAVAKGVALLPQITASLPAAVRGDEGRVRQILVNLMSNSIKFTAHGEVELRVTCTGQNSDRVRLRCEVRDTGIGIEAEALERLFTPFTQADASTTRRFGGTGLGLSIARRFVHMMGGEIGVSSKVGVGSIFWFEIPLGVVKGVAGSINKTCGQGLFIMIASARESAHDELGSQIRALGWNPRIATSGRAIKEFLADLETDAMPDVVIADLHLTDMDALQLIADLDADLPGGGRPAFIVIAGSTQDYLMNALKICADDLLLAGPVTSSTLFNSVNMVVSKRAGGHQRLLDTAAVGEDRAHWLSEVRILVVDDSSINLEVARRILERQGATIHTCTNGLAAVDFVRAHARDLDIVLMDVQMPVLDGNAAARRIREELHLAEPPILALTAGALMGERQRCLESGMSDVVTKPFEPQTLIRKIRELIEDARGAPLPVVILDQAPAAASFGPAFPASLDARIVQQMFGEDVALFRGLLERLLRDFADLALPMKFTSDDATVIEQLRGRAHKLKGSSSMIGATDVAQLAGALETTLKGRPAGDHVDALLKRLAVALTTLRDETRAYGAALTLGDEHPSPGQDTGAQPSRLDIQKLVALLDQHNLSAMDTVSDQAQSLCHLLGEMRFRQLTGAIDDLNFSLAASLLNEALRNWTPSPTPMELTAT